ncbi:olfactory receptor class A-like protein 1 [Rhinatrema bivittatum]|uniref:olfactory receptor class A-like protein 1 n=1 Tax=Rhinatrema bivittatum TaxID=194408 RepID=UPI00112B01DE|nr:olfactory receptor class A-like protein 1 [Rhinatrema bivittatum]
MIGNAVVLVLFSFLACQERKILPSEVIVLNLAAANLVMAVTRGLPHALYVLGVGNFFSDTGCKAVIYTARVSRALSICLTCFLSCFQAVTLASTSVSCMRLKLHLQTQVLPIVFLLLLVNAAFCISPLLFTISGTNMTNLKYAFSVGHCLVIFPDKLSLHGNSFALFARDLLFVAAMSGASSYIVCTLYRHGKRVRGIRSSERSQKISAEANAARMVTSLVLLYGVFFGIDNTIWLYQNAWSMNSLAAATDARYFFSICYTSVFPVVILIFNQRILYSVKGFPSQEKLCVKETSKISSVE